MQKGMRMMYNNKKNKCVLYIIFFLLVKTNTVCADIIQGSFDILFPQTWYEKMLSATASVWHMMNNYDVGNVQDDDAIVCDIVLGRLVFAYFCMKKIEKEEHCLLPEDGMYLTKIVSEIKNIFLKHKVSDHTHCCVMMLDKMMKMLLRLDIPCNIKTE